MIIIKFCKCKLKLKNKLFFNILNWSEKFFSPDGFHWSVQKTFIIIKEFIDAAVKMIRQTLYSRLNLWNEIDEIFSLWN